MNRVGFYTLGCKVNQYETDYIAQIFVENGYKIVDYNDYADVYVINSCTVTNVSDKKSRQLIRRAKSKNCESILVVMGCYSQANPEILEKFENIDIIIGTENKLKVIDFINEFKIKCKKLNKVTNSDNIIVFEDFLSKAYSLNTRAFLKIQDGCNRYCSYCIIPYVRGKSRSRKIQSIINEVNILAENGYKEVVLTGIHLTSFGVDTGENLFELLIKINSIKGIERIRLGSLDPTFINDYFIDKINMINKICPHFHISLQSGCNSVLKRMNRKYSTEEYLSRVEKLRVKIKDVIITTDIIVGFPGETEDEFLETVDFVKNVGFYRIHVFKFSKRDGTKAARMTNQIDGVVKEKRSNLLIELSDELTIKENDKYIGKNVKVLFEQIYKEDKKYFEGLTNNYIRVIVETKLDLKSKIKDVYLCENIGKIINGKLL